MKFFENLGRLIKRGEPAKQTVDSAQNYADREASLNQNAEQIRSAFEQGHGVPADHTRLETIRGHLAEIQAKRDNQTGIPPVNEIPLPARESDQAAITRRLTDVSKLKKPQ